MAEGRWDTLTPCTTQNLRNSGAPARACYRRLEHYLVNVYFESAGAFKPFIPWPVAFDQKKTLIKPRFDPYSLSLANSADENIES